MQVFHWYCSFPVCLLGYVIWKSDLRVHYFFCLINSHEKYKKHKDKGQLYIQLIDCIWNVMAHVQKPDFIFWWNGLIKRSQNNFFFTCGTLARFWVMPSPYGSLQSHSLDTLHSGLVWTSDHPDRRPLPDNTHHSQETDYHAAGGIPTQNPSKWAATDLCLSPHSHWDRPSRNSSQRKYVILWNNNFI